MTGSLLAVITDEEQGRGRTNIAIELAERMEELCDE